MAKDGGVFVWEWLADPKPLVPDSPEMIDEGDEDDSEKPQAESEDSESDGSFPEEARKEVGERSSSTFRTVRVIVVGLGG